MNYDKYFADYFMSKKRKGFDEDTLKDLLLNELSLELGIKKIDIHLGDDIMVTLLNANSGLELQGILRSIEVDTQYQVFARNLETNKVREAEESMRQERNVRDYERQQEKEINAKNEEYLLERKK